MAGPTVERLLGKDAITALRRPIAQARGLPAAAYASPEFFRLEQTRLFPRTWMCVGFASDIPAPGDAMPIDAAGAPLIAVRGADGAVRVFHNVCTHRAAMILTAPQSGLKQFQCPYHAWAFDLDGRLKATPFFDGTKDGARCKVDMAKRGLKPVRSATWHHWLFVNLAGNAPPFAEHVRPLEDMLSGADIGATRPAHRENWAWNANWKFQSDNWETYHHIWVHPTVFTKLGDDLDFETGLPKHEPVQNGTVITLRRRAGADLYPSAGLDLPYVPLPEGADRRRSTSLLFPNMTLTMRGDHLASVVAIPLAADRTVSQMGYFFVGDAATSPAHAAGRKRVLDQWLGPTRRQEDRGGIRSQDMAMWETQQRARATSIADDVIFSPVWEGNVHHFQNLLIDVMTKADKRAGKRKTTAPRKRRAKR